MFKKIRNKFKIRIKDYKISSSDSPYFYNIKCVECGNISRVPFNIAGYKCTCKAINKSKGFQLKKDRDYIIMPVTGSDIVAFDSNPADYYDYVHTNYGSGWEYKATIDVKGERCLLWGK